MTAACTWPASAGYAGSSRSTATLPSGRACSFKSWRPSARTLAAAVKPSLISTASNRLVRLLRPSSMDSKLRDAVTAILDLATRHQVVMVNEAHHVPLHRAFTILLLEDLYKKGFRYFAAESLSEKDAYLQRRGYPTFDTGFYTHEPVYGDLVRIALRLGYTVVPYEYIAARPPAEANDPAAAQNEREEGQVHHLKQRILDKDPQAKILVHAGYGHIGEMPAVWNFGGKKGEVRFMAASFKRLAGIDPLTIDQTQMTEHSDPRYEYPEYRAAVDNGLVRDRPVLLWDPTKKAFFVPERAKGNHDLFVFHPRTRYENGRPTWLAPRRPPPAARP